LSSERRKKLVKHKRRFIRIITLALVFAFSFSSLAASAYDGFLLPSYSRFSSLERADISDISVASLHIGASGSSTKVVTLQTERAADPEAKPKPSKSAAAPQPSAGDGSIINSVNWRPPTGSAAEYINPDGTTRSDIATPAELSGQPSQLYTVTFYCACMICCGKTNAITASMAPAVAGITVAASSTIPFGTRIWVEGYGERIVQDRGGAIGQNRLDIYVNTHDEAYRHGVKSKQIWFL
jgi:3D (Asp-Asp-Asp) domain-containing protein